METNSCVLIPVAQIDAVTKMDCSWCRSKTYSSMQYHVHILHRHNYAKFYNWLLVMIIFTFQANHSKGFHIWSYAQQTDNLSRTQEILCVFFWGGGARNFITVLIWPNSSFPLRTVENPDLDFKCSWRYRGVDKSLARLNSQCILFDCENS